MEIIDLLDKHASAIFGAIGAIFGFFSNYFLKKYERKNEITKEGAKEYFKQKMFVLNETLKLISEYEITRKILETLMSLKFSVIIQTKSCLVLRDIDILKQFKECEVGFTITTLDEKIRKIFEPFSSPVEKKLEALKLLKENEIKTYVFFGPVLPYLSDESLEEYFESMKKLEVDEVMIDKFNLKPGLWNKLKKLLEKNYPELISRWRKVLFEKNNYYENLRRKIREICRKRNLKCVFCY